ncbi:MAG: hypothetical protein WC716_04335 [Chitinophagaceae bacterium]|jgi:DNA repair exonuclease SbcCD ATPase subunit
MINIDTIKAELESFFANVENVSENLFRCKRFYKGEAYQVVYIDTSNNIPFDNIDSYLKENISQDYFQNKGNLQWNFYLIFLTDKVFKDGERILIEGNPDYARKLIIKPDEFSDWLRKSYITTNVKNSGVELGLSDIWRNHLKENDLDFILFDKIPLNEGINRVLNEDKNVISQTQVSQEFDPKDIELGQLRFLDPGNFREYPIYNEPFEFKQVNLIDGANGFGKTSLLESIEFFFTGKNLRTDESPADCNIKVRFDLDKDYKIFQNNSALFRERDKVWYKSVRLIRGNELNLHFNHFNFYNTDTAFKLSHSKTNVSDVNEAFEAVALGEEVNLIRRQIAKYQTRLGDEIKSRQKEIGNLNSDIESEEQIISNLRSSKENDIVLIESVYDRAKELGLNLTDQKTSNSLEELKAELIAYAAEISQLTKSINWIEELSMAQLLLEEINLDKIKKEFDDYLAIKSNNEKLIHETHQKISESIALEKMLSELLTYYKYDVSLFNNLTENIRRNELLIARLNLISEKRERIFSVLDRSSNLQVSRIRIEQEKILSTKKIEHSKIIGQIEIAENTISKVNSLKAKIKSDGKMLLSLESEQSNCPLCKTNFNTNQELLLAIIQEVDSTLKTENFDSLLTAKIELEREIQQTIDCLSEISNLIQVVNVILEIKIDDKLDFQSAYNLIDAELKNVELIQEQLSAQKSFRDQIEHEGLSENRFEEINTLYMRKFPKQNLSQSSIEKGIFEQQESQLKLRQIEENSTSDFLIKKSEVDKNLKSYSPEIGLEEDSEIMERVISIKYYVSVCSKIFNSNFDQNKDIRILQLDLNTVLTQLDDIKSNLEIEKRESEFIQKAKEVKAEKCSKRDLLSTEEKKLQKSLDALNRLLEHNSEADFLQKFLQANNEELKRIFLTIHTPKEFKDVMISNGRIVLKKFNNVDKDLMSISTGQRSALALSLFLVLNNKLSKGPNVIIFDDPVAFTDDINILSFLDYIREVILKDCKKQLFFATANENLSFLFQKKFEMLGDEFKHITLMR